MQNTKEHIKVLSILSLAASDAREDTLTSVLHSTLNELGPIDRQELSYYIKETFGFEPYKEELDELLGKSLREGKIHNPQNNVFALTEDEKRSLQTAELELKDKDKARYQNFRMFLIQEGFDQLQNRQMQQLWSTFIEYIYNNFFDYGEEALKMLHPHLTYSGKFENDGDYFQVAYALLKDKELCKIFRVCVEKFPDYASQNDIDFLNDLAQKTLSFASLGIAPKMAETALDLSLVDWVLYLDTNVLYSILNLHSHPENEATKALINLINENKDHLKIVLRYSELTKKELNSKREDFNLLDEKLTDSGIRAIIKSEDLDDFSKQFYINLLENRDTTLHPAKVIELASTLLNNNKIDISRNAKRIEHLGDEYLKLKIQDYHNFIDFKNSTKQEFCESKKITFYPIYKSNKQITHDISLRELLLDLRTGVKGKDSNHTGFNSVKYFGLTLDGLLSDFDISQIKDYSDERSFPVFFRPSFLLSKLVRILPIKTTDYKKAFIKAVTSKGFNKDIKKSRNILKIVNFLKSQGIDEEKVIYNMISEDIFLEKYGKNSREKEFREEEFIGSELNKQFQEREEELVKASLELEKKKGIADKTTEENRQLKLKEGKLKSEIDIYKKAVSKLQSDFSQIEKRASLQNTNQSSINFEAENAKKELGKTKRELLDNIEEQIESLKTNSLVRWQKRIWWNLLWVVPLTVSTITLVLFPSLLPNTTIDKISIRIILGLALFLADGIFIHLIKSRYWDEGNKQKKRENTKIPKELQSKLNAYK